MLFNSIDFLYFFPIVVFLYFIVPFKYRWILLLTSSYYFYMSWKAEYAILIMLSTLVDYYVAIKLEKSENEVKRKFLLAISLSINLGLLFTFKYFNFFSQSITEVIRMYSLNFTAPNLKFLLPVGISFYTFQTLGYTIDVYRKKIKAEKHLGIFAVYVSFFPQLVAGPIERAKNLIPQFFEKHSFDFSRIASGLRLMLWGFFKKIVIADRLAITVNLVYNNPSEQAGLTLLIATIFFAFQIFCDFSGYSDIAIGSARVMGYELMTNFRRPYFAKSISEFWQRWHISLSTWFKDYLYIPLGGNRVSKIRWYSNLLIVFLISGLWHGANWTFIIWGGLHGLYLIFSIISKNTRGVLMTKIGLAKHKTIHNVLQIGTTFILVNFAWIFFRSNSVSDSFLIINKIFSDFSLDISSLQIGNSGIIHNFFLIGFLEIIHLLQEKFSINKKFNDSPVFLRWASYIIIIVAILLFGVFEEAEFIYFQF